MRWDLLGNADKHRFGSPQLSKPKGRKISLGALGTGSGYKSAPW
ncbi:hypothetical protein NPIL_220141, partial [Nephila pilipes]